MMFAFAAAVFLIYCYSIQLVISQCLQNCQNCSDTNQCFTCKFGYWGTYVSCVNKCSNNCTNSNCDDNGYCYACVNGMYGPSCKENCQLCKNGECGLRECTLGCKDGYVKYISENYSYCFPCQDNCQLCQNSSYCTLCDTGYYIFKYTYDYEPKRGIATCTSCQSNNVCNECSKLSNCSQCSLSNNTIVCEHCVDGYTLDNHQCMKNIACPLNCLNGCTHDGVCTGCIDDKTGNKCEYLCAGGCSKCSQTNQDLCTACKDGFYTSTCNILCPQNCATRQCGFNNGNCLNGCLSGFRGDKCEDKCSEYCKQSECNKDGTCSYGCTAGYDGLYCNITMTTTKTIVLTSSSTSGLVPSITRSESSSTTVKTTVLTSSSSSEIGESTVCNCQVDRSSFGSVLGGAVAGAVVITALFVGSIAFFLHRRSVSRTSNKEQRTDSMYYNTVGRSSINEENGQNIKASEMGTNQAPEISVYDHLSGTQTDHVYSGL